MRLSVQSGPKQDLMYHTLLTLLLPSVSGLRSICENSVHQARPRHHQDDGLSEEELVCVFRRKLVVLGGQGSGKSSLANSFLGWRLGDDMDNPGPFHVGHGVEVSKFLLGTRTFPNLL